MSKPIEGKVAQVLNEREVAINIGTEHGVETDMKFEILSEKPIIITDPDTGDEIGTIDRVKVRVKAVEVQPRMSIARTYETYQVNVGGAGPLFPALTEIAEISRRFVPEKWVTRVKTLRIDQSDLPGPLDEKYSIVRQGDRVRQIVETD
jgi:hypothetical protein